MDLFKAVPALRHHPLLSGKRVALVGVSTIVRDDIGLYFEVSKPKYWQRRDDGSTSIGVGGIGGGLKQGESVLAGLRREVQEELGARARFESSPLTYLVHEWQIADTVALPASKKRLPPLMVILTPGAQQIEGEHDAIPYRSVGPVTAEEYESRADRYDEQLRAAQPPHQVGQ